MKQERTVFPATMALCAVVILACAFAFLPRNAYAEDGELAAGVVNVEAVQEDELQTQASDQAMYRMYNPWSGEHFYTANKGERNSLVPLGWHYEGIGWMAPAAGDDVYRLYNPNSGDHHYTLSAQERNWLVTLGWRYEGVGWKSAQASDTSRSPLYRQFNPNAITGTHNFTLHKQENDSLARIGWHAEGVGWYGHWIPAGYPDDMAPWTAHISGNVQLDTQLDMILQHHRTLWQCYEYVSNMSYREGNRFWGNPHYLPNSTTIPYAYEMATLHSGNCYRYACLLSWLARGLGYDSQVVSGWVPSYSGGRAPHGWVEIRENGRTLICDPDMNHELRGYNWFMVTYQNAPTTYGSW